MVCRIERKLLVSWVIITKMVHFCMAPVEMCLLLRHSICFDYSFVSRCLLRSR